MRLIAIAIIALAALGGCTTAQPEKLRALIVDGVNNHDWQVTTQAVRETLEESGRFEVSVATSPPRGASAEAWAAWRPRFAEYDVVIGNFNGGHIPSDAVFWPEATQEAFVAYVREGGGFVSLHAANNSFPGWAAYEDMVGLLWRDKSYGPSVVIEMDGRPRVVPTGEGHEPGHGDRHDFEMVVIAADHPITNGMPRRWMHPAEQLTHGQHGPEDAVRSDAFTYLTYAWSRDVNEREPMDWVRRYGLGRVYVTMLGHAWAGEENPNLDAPGFRAMLARGAEWAATGEVTLAPPYLGGVAAP